MDHLDAPEDCEPLSLTVPYFLSDIVPYDGDGYRSYPFKTNYISDEDTFSSAQFMSHAPEHVASFVQEWLFFGLLREVLGMSYTRSEFIAADDASHTGSRITTIQLPIALESVAHYYKHTADAGGSNIFGRTRHRHGASPSKYLDDILDFAVEQVRRIDEPLSSVPGWPELLLSINILVETLRTLSLTRSDSYDTKMGAGSLITHHDAPSAKAIGERLLRQKGWCVHQYRWACRHVSYSTLHYLGNIRRHFLDSIDHAVCAENPRCIAYNVDVETYEPVHVEKGCTCDYARAPEGQMHAILREGGIPVLRCARQGDEITLTYAKASPFSPYVAISHLWADGLGNPRGNYIPSCRLKQLYSQVADIYRSQGKIRKMLEQEEYVPGRLWRAYDNAIHRGRLHARPEGSNIISIWLDVYCVPTTPTPGYDVDTGTDARGIADSLETLKTAALNRMPATYAWASAVLVYDSELAHIEEHHGTTETMAKLALCGWSSRCWTFQEMCLAHRALLYCGNYPRVEVDIAVQYAWKRHGESVYFDTVGPGEVYKPQRSVSELYSSLVELLGKRRVVNGTYSPPWLGSARFLSVQFAHSWDQLAHRDTTRHQDALSILANLVDLPAGSVLKLDKQYRMKAILKSFPRLPFGILTANTLRYGDPGANDGQPCEERDRWIPCAAQDDRLMRDHREPAVDAVEIRDEGLRIKSPWFIPKNMTGLTAVSITPPPGQRWVLSIRGDLPASHTRTAKLLIQLNGTPSFTDPRIGADTRGGEHLLLLDHCFHSMNAQRIKDRWDHGRGALLRISKTTRGAVHTSFVCSLTFHPYPAPDPPPGDAHPCEAVLCEKPKDVVLDCDISTWPRLHSRRARGRYRRSRYFLRMVVLGAPLVLALGLAMAAVGTFSDLTGRGPLIGLDLRLLGVEIVLLTLGVSVAAWIARLFLVFLIMHSYVHEDVDGPPWYERLEGMMPDAGRVIGPRLRFEATVVRVLTLGVVGPVRVWWALRRRVGWLLWRAKGGKEE